VIVHIEVHNKSSRYCSRIDCRQALSRCLNMGNDKMCVDDIEVQSGFAIDITGVVVLSCRCMLKPWVLEAKEAT